MTCFQTGREPTYSLLKFYRTYGPADLPESSDTTGRVHLVVVACQGKTNGIVLEASTMIKSAMMFSTDRLNIHIFTDTLTEDFLREVTNNYIDSISICEKPIYIAILDGSNSWLKAL